MELELLRWFNLITTSNDNVNLTYSLVSEISEPSEKHYFVMLVSLNKYLYQSINQSNSNQSINQNKISKFDQSIRSSIIIEQSYYLI